MTLDENAYSAISLSLILPSSSNLAGLKSLTRRRLDVNFRDVG